MVLPMEDRILKMQYVTVLRELCGIRRWTMQLTVIRREAHGQPNRRMPSVMYHAMTI